MPTQDDPRTELLQYRVDVSTRSGQALIDLKAPEIQKFETEIGGQPHTCLTSPGIAGVATEGHPNLPRELIQLAIPDRACDVVLSVSHIRHRHQQIANPVVPVPSRVGKEFEYRKNLLTYRRRTPLQTTPAEVVGTRLSRGIRVVDIALNWINYTPVMGRGTGDLDRISSMRLTVTFRLADRFQIPEPRVGVRREELDQVTTGLTGAKELLEFLRDHPLESFDLGQPHVHVSRRDLALTNNRGEYLIIIDENNIGAVHELFLAKQQRYSVKVVSVQQIEAEYGFVRLLVAGIPRVHRLPRHEAMLAFMHDAYYWEERPKFLLLVGDNENVPGYRMECAMFQQSVWSDQRYTSLADDDYSSWCCFGRICSSDYNEIQAICTHLLEYPGLRRGAWTKRVILTGWMPTSPHTAGGLLDPGYPFEAAEHDERAARGLFDLAWPQPGEASSWHGNSRTKHYRVVRHFQWRECHPAVQETDCATHNRTADKDPLRNVKYWDPLDSTPQSLADEINRGAIIVRYNGHGSGDGWENVGHEHRKWGQGTAIHLAPASERQFVKAHVEALSTEECPPLVLSLACLTGEIFDPNYDPANPPPMQEVNFAETWQRQRKAIGVYAADGETDIYYNDRMGRCVFRQITQEGLTKIGEVLRRANERMMDDYGGGGVRSAIRNYRYFGDPDTDLRY